MHFVKVSLYKNTKVHKVNIKGKWAHMPQHQNDMHVSISCNTVLACAFDLHFMPGSTHKIKNHIQPKLHESQQLLYLKNYKNSVRDNMAAEKQPLHSPISDNRWSRNRESRMVDTVFCTCWSIASLGFFGVCVWVCVWVWGIGLHMNSYKSHNISSYIRWQWIVLKSYLP